MRWRASKRLPILVAGLCMCAPASAQFRDDFDGPVLQGWTNSTGAGSATMQFRQQGGVASILVDAAKDQNNIWWALIKRNVSASLDLKRLAEPGRELRIEARIRSSHAPRRVNLHANTQKTTDFHSHLMEYDIPDTESWHTISMTTRGFRAGPGDIVNTQLALMDWGLGKYRVDLDYFKVDVVDAATAGPDLGSAVPYHPPIPDPGTFAEKVRVAQDGMIDLQHPNLNFNNWYSADGGKKAPVLTVSGSQIVILRWDLSAYAGKLVTGHGLLELNTRSVERTATRIAEFGQVRVVEILGGDPAWDQRSVTLASFTRGQPLDSVLNTQMIIDVDVSEGQGGRRLITISKPVLQRLVDGKTLGLAIRPLGPINAVFYASEHDGGISAARLHFNLRRQ
jgi:hypothetical protein